MRSTFNRMVTAVVAVLTYMRSSCDRVSTVNFTFSVILSATVLVFSAVGFNSHSDERLRDSYVFEFGYSFAVHLTGFPVLTLTLVGYDYSE